MIRTIRRLWESRLVRLDEEERRREDFNVMLLAEFHEDDFMNKAQHRYEAILQETPDIDPSVAAKLANEYAMQVVKPNEAPALRQYYDTKRQLIAEGLAMGMTRKQAHVHMVALLPLSIGVKYVAGK